MFGSGCMVSDIGNSFWYGMCVLGFIVVVCNNGVGISGVVFGVCFLFVCVFGKCGGYDSDIIVGMKWVVGFVVLGLFVNINKVKVFNLSLGGSGSCSSIDSIGFFY